MTDPYVPDRPVICPYNSSHVIASSRFQKHLIKCSKNYPPDYMLTCPYNATHRLFKSDFDNHTFVCPDRQYIDPSIYQDNQQHGKFVSSNNMDDQEPIGCQESWDEKDNYIDELCTAAFCQTTNPMAPTRYENVPSRAAESITNRTRELPRPPRGVPEALMREESEDSIVDDAGSVASFMGLGRGKPWTESHKEISIKIGRGRGSAQTKL